MNVKIKIIVSPRSNPMLVEYPVGTTAEQLVKDFQKDLPYDILLAKIDHKFEELTYALTKDCTVEFLDMRSQAGNLVYQRSVSMLYLKAIRDVLGHKATAVIENSLSKGLYTYIKGSEPLSSEVIQKIQSRMEELVKEDIKFERAVDSKGDAMKWLLEDGLQEKARMLQHAMDVDQIKFYSLGGLKNFFYGLMVPSTGYIKRFELVPYRRGIILRFPHPKDPNVIPEFIDEFKLYNAFAEIKSWGKLMKITYVGDMNEMVENEGYKDIIQISEALHEKKIAHIADMITKGKKRIVLIAGPSSSGKTTFAKRLSIQLRVNGLDPIYMSTDDYFVERGCTPLDEYGEPNFEDIEAIDIELFNRNMNGLLAGDEVDLPVFDFIRGTKQFGKKIVRAESTQPIVIEGIHGLNTKLTESIPLEQKFKIYISPLTQLNIDEHNRIPTTDARMLRRMVRDYQFRGHSAQSTIREWPKVRAGEDKNIFPFNGEADVFFNSVHIYELSVLKKYAEPLLKEIKPEEREYADAVRILKFLNFFQTIEDDSMIANNSIMREFIGGSIFV